MRNRTLNVAFRRLASAVRFQQVASLENIHRAPQNTEELQIENLKLFAVLLQSDWARIIESSMAENDLGVAALAKQAAVSKRAVRSAIGGHFYSLQSPVRNRILTATVGRERIAHATFAALQGQGAEQPIHDIS